MLLRGSREFLLMIFCWMLFCTCNAAPDANAKLQLIELNQRQDHTVLTFTLKKNTQAHFFTLDNPDRLVIDMPQTKASSALPKNIQSNGLIQRIRLGTGPAADNNLRLVIDLAAKSQYVYLEDHNDKTQQQKLTVILNSTKAPSTIAEPTSIDDIANTPLASGSSMQQAEKKLNRSLSTQDLGVMPEPLRNSTRIQNAQMSKVVVMIDPGHGGKDSGAIGPGGVMEKNVVLSISKKLQADLDQNAGVDARLTRKGDYFIPLRQRLNIARFNKSNIFIAIHADAFNNTDAQGASVFALSQHGATSEAARWLAERENTSELCGINIKDKDYLLKSVLLDMSQTATIQDSLKLGDQMLDQLQTCTPLHADRVEQAGFMVLKSPDIPSVLVETGFVTNPQEEKLLSTPDYQAKIAQAIAAGVVDYFKRNPPPNTLFEMQYKT